MKENNYYKSEREQRPNCRHTRTALCVVFLASLLPGVASAVHTPATTLHSDDSLPLVSLQAEMNQFINSSDGRMPALAGDAVEIATTEERPHEVGAPVIPGPEGMNAPAGQEGSPTRNADAQQHSMPASITRTDYVAPDHNRKINRTSDVSTRELGDRTSIVVVRENDDQLQLPYALVLALIAIISLVPVSRRNR